MKQISQKHELEVMGGFSDIRLRFYILGFLSVGLIMTPYLGMLASFNIAFIFGIFTAVKINEFQQNNPESILLHCQAMDRMYNYSAKAEYFEDLLKPFEIKVENIKSPIKPNIAKQPKQISNVSYQNLVFSK